MTAKEETLNKISVCHVALTSARQSMHVGGKLNTRTSQKMARHNIADDVRVSDARRRAHEQHTHQQAVAQWKTLAATLLTMYPALPPCCMRGRPPWCWIVQARAWVNTLAHAQMNEYSLPVGA